MTSNIPKEMLDELLTSGYGAFETGVKELPTGEIYVANLVPAPHMTGAMFDWWFGEYLSDTSQYKFWHKDHTTMALSENKKPGTMIGASQISAEKLGDQLVPMEIRFFDPMTVFTKEQFQDAKISGGVCAEIVSEGNEMGMFIHLIRDTFYGADIRTRMILKMGGLEMGINTNKHNIEEMVHLAQFLPGLYKMYHQD